MSSSQSAHIEHFSWDAVLGWFLRAVGDVRSMRESSDFTDCSSFTCTPSLSFIDEGDLGFCCACGGPPTAATDDAAALLEFILDSEDGDFLGSFRFIALLFALPPLDPPVQSIEL